MNVFLSFLVGLLFTALCFCSCVLTVLGAKTLYLTVKSRLTPKQTAQQAEQAPKEPPPVEKTPKKVRSIRINPDEVDRIYVKKSS